MSAPEFTTDQRPLDSSAGGSRPSKTNRQDPIDRVQTPNSDVVPSDLCGETGLRPVSVEKTKVRPEAAMIETADGFVTPAENAGVDPADPENTVKARPWYRVLAEWRDWYEGYENSHIEFEREDGKLARTRLENSYQPGYGNRYYAKLKDLERGIEREFESLTTVMLTFSASTLNANGNPRCPADHMRGVADGWDTARKQLYPALSGFRWEYAKVWEPTSETGEGPAGYGHLHAAIFVEADETEIGAGTFEATMRSYTENVEAAGWDAHRPDGDAVSVSHGLGSKETDGESLNNLASYITEYIGTFGERALERPMHEQQFYAVTWATQTQRVTFSNGANELISAEQFRRETGLRPEDRGGDDGDTEPREGAEWLSEDGRKEEPEWDVKRLCTVQSRTPQYSDPTAGGVVGVKIEPRGGDPPRNLK